MAIAPCHYCGKPVNSTDFPHNVVCVLCVGLKQIPDESMQDTINRLARERQLVG